MSLQRRPEEEALDRVILELRDQPTQELPWHDIEARLMRQAQLAARPPAAVAWFSRFRLPAAGLFAVATLGVLISTHRRAVVPAPSAPVAQRVATLSVEPLNGNQLALGTRISAGSKPVTVAHKGQAQWTLEPHAAAALSEAGEFLTVRLESGALSARVVPSPKLETFAVEVGGTRIAVHGTAFRVERAGDRVLVSVSEGTVAIEPTGTHFAPSFLLRRDSRGSFELDGRTGSVEGNASVVAPSRAQSHRELTPRAATRTNSAQPRAHASALPALPARTPDPDVAAHDLPEQPSISDTERGVSAALELMNRCFHDQTRSSGIRVSASTGLTLTVSPAGTVQSVTFAPPLAPAVEDCAVNDLRNLNFPRSLDGITFTRVFELVR